MPSLLAPGGLAQDSNAIGEKTSKAYADAVFALRQALGRYTATVRKAALAGKPQTPHTLAAALVACEHVVERTAGRTAGKPPVGVVNTPTTTAEVEITPSAAVAIAGRGRGGGRSRGRGRGGLGRGGGRGGSSGMALGGTLLSAGSGSRMRRRRRGSQNCGSYTRTKTRLRARNASQRPAPPRLEINTKDDDLCSLDKSSRPQRVAQAIPQHTNHRHEHVPTHYQPSPRAGLTHPPPQVCGQEPTHPPHGP